MTATMTWLRQTRRTYFGNAAAQRDFRVQLRGNRSLLVFGLYLSILIGVAFFKYAEVAGASTVSVVSAQRELRDFYALVVFLLGGMVSVVTPGLAATAITLERQRRSLDLVFSAPVEPRYYLVGKAIAVYRYTWMLLVLSLPVTAACVVLGGASWTDVLTVYALLSFHGLLFASIGLLVSTLSNKPVSAVIWTYAAVGGYLFVSGYAAAGAYAYARLQTGVGSGDTPFAIGLNPFGAVYSVGTHTTLLGHEVPNLLLAVAAILVMVRLCLLGAGSVLSEGRETSNLRLHWVAVTALAALGLGYWFVSSGAYSSLTPTQTDAEFRPLFGGVDPHAVTLGYGLFWLLSPLVIVLPILAVYGTDGALRQRANGWFSPRRALDGTPAGALPYVALLVVTATGFGFAGLKAAGGALPSISFAPYVLYALGFWSLFWAIGRVASSYGMGVKAARTTVVAAMIVLAVLPAPFLSSLTPETFNQSGTSAWDLYLLRPVLQFNSVNLALPLVYGVGMIALALGLNAWSERNRIRS